MRRQLQICTEADYLQAHLTVIDKKTRRRIMGFRNIKRGVMSVWKKCIFVKP
jgi:hypothetical protein